MYIIEPQNRIRSILQRRDFGAEVDIRGWLRTRRDSKAGFSFLEISDGSSMTNIQVVADNDLENYQSEVLHLTAGCSVDVRGELRESPGKGQAVEVLAKNVQVVGWVEDSDTYPLQKKRHSLEFLREVAHLRPRSNTIGAVARVRSRLSRAIHDFFQDRGFLYLHTPIITSSDAEGAGEMFTVTTLPIEEMTDEECWTRDFFARRTALTVSGQLSAETYACALTNVYTFGPTFRAENSNTSRHLAEFWMIEPEMAFCDLEGDMELAEDFIRSLVNTALTDCSEDLAFFGKFIDKELEERLAKLSESSFERMSYTEAIETLESSGKKFEYPVEWGCDLQSEHERYLTEQVVGGPVIVYDYPRDIKAFYMRMNDDGKTVAAMDVLVPRAGEIIGGSQREERKDVLIDRMRELGLDPADYAWYLDLRRYGTVPHAGFGLGFERLIQYITGLGNVRDVIPYPRTPRSAEF
ncbi:MAG: asparagine--tRNA ligase [Candidatus Sumerlaeota bacterium]